jgi:hypothetical protein
MSLWQYFKRVELWCSVDGYGPLNDWIRYPSQWKTITSNLDRIDKSSDNIYSFVNMTISILNIEYIPELYNFITLQNYQKIGHWDANSHIPLALDLVYDPQHLNVRVLPQTLKNRITKKLSDHANGVNNQQYCSQMYHVLAYMNAVDWSYMYSESVRYIEEVENIRNIKYPFHYGTE